METIEKNNVLTTRIWWSTGKWRYYRLLNDDSFIFLFSILDMLSCSHGSQAINFLFLGHYKKDAGSFERGSNKDCQHFHVQNTLCIYRLITNSWKFQLKSIHNPGSDCISWLLSNLKFCNEKEAVHFASLLCCHGYLFPIDDHVMAVKHDNNTLYR